VILSVRAKKKFFLFSKQLLLLKKCLEWNTIKRNQKESMLDLIKT